MQTKILKTTKTKRLFAYWIRVCGDLWGLKIKLAQGNRGRKKTRKVRWNETSWKTQRNT